MFDARTKVMSTSDDATKNVAAREMLVSAGVDEDDIRTEDFAGY
jgi:hypothetical protein